MLMSLLRHDYRDYGVALFLSSSMRVTGFPGSSAGKESACNAGDLGYIPGLGRSPGEGHGNPLQYSCLEKPHGQRSLVGYSPWGHKESDTTEQLSAAQHSTKVTGWPDVGDLGRVCGEQKTRGPAVRARPAVFCQGLLLSMVLLGHRAEARVSSLKGESK